MPCTRAEARWYNLMTVLAHVVEYLYQRYALDARIHRYIRILDPYARMSGFRGLTEGDPTLPVGWALPVERHTAYPKDPQSCPHTGRALSRYGNAIGSFARCDLCGMRWLRKKGAPETEWATLDPLPYKGATAKEARAKAQQAGYRPVPKAAFLAGYNQASPGTPGLPGTPGPPRILGLLGYNQTSV